MKGLDTSLSGHARLALHHQAYAGKLIVYVIFEKRYLALPSLVASDIDIPLLGECAATALLQDAYQHTCLIEMHCTTCNLHQCPRGKDGTVPCSLSLHLLLYMNITAAGAFAS